MKKKGLLYAAVGGAFCFSPRKLHSEKFGAFAMLL